MLQVSFFRKLEENFKWKPGIIAAAKIITLDAAVMLYITTYGIS